MSKETNRQENPAKERDRRNKFRFPIRRELKYKVLDEGSVVDEGTGWSMDVSSGGVAFVVGRELKAGALLELSMSWPVLLDDTCPMKLIVFGRVLRSHSGTTVCTVDKYEFRTQARQGSAQVSRKDSMLQRFADSMRKDTMKLRVASV